MRLRCVLVCEFDETKHDSVKVFFGYRAVFERFVNAFVVESFASRHFKIKSCFYAFAAVVNRAPVAHDDTLETPFVTEYVGEKTLVVGKVFAVETIV